MSLEIPTPQSLVFSDSEVISLEVPDSSQDPLFSESDTIGDFSDEQGAHSQESPSISSFTSPSENSQSILRNVAIVSSDPKVVEQISPQNDAAIVSSDQMSVEQIPPTNDSKDSNDVSNSSSVSGPKEVSINNVERQKVAYSNKGNKSKSMGAKQPDPTRRSNQIVNSQIDHPFSGVADSDSSSSEPSFKAPRPPRARRESSQSPARSRSRSPLVPSSPSGHRGIPQVVLDRPSRRS